MSLLKKYDEICKEFNIDSSITADDEFKLQFAQAQFDELKKILWRESVDYVISTELAESNDEMIRATAQSKVTEKRTNIRQFSKALKTYKTLIEELSK